MSAHLAAETESCFPSNLDKWIPPPLVQMLADAAVRFPASEPPYFAHACSHSNISLMQLDHPPSHANWAAACGEHGCGKPVRRVSSGSSLPEGTAARLHGEASCFVTQLKAGIAEDFLEATDPRTFAE